MRRLFWIVVGVGLGATAAVQASRYLKRTTARYAPAAVAGRARTQVGELIGAIAERGRLALEEGRAEMRAREAELRADLGL